MSRINLNDCIKQMREEAEVTKPTNEQFEEYAKLKPHLYGSMETHSFGCRCKVCMTPIEATKPQEPVKRIELYTGHALVLDAYPYEDGNWRGDNWRIVSEDGAHIRYLDGVENTLAVMLQATPQPCQRCTELEAERDALTMQNQQIREALTLWKIASDNSEECEFDDMAAYSIPMPLFCDADEATEAALALLDTSEIIKRHDAAVLRKYADSLDDTTSAWSLESLAVDMDKSCPTSN